MQEYTESKDVIQLSTEIVYTKVIPFTDYFDLFMLRSSNF